MNQLRPTKAIQALKKLREEGEAPGLAADKLAFDAWQSKVRGVLVDAFGEGDQTVVRFSGIQYWPTGLSRNDPDS
jgi:hypothetical protein